MNHEMPCGIIAFLLTFRLQKAIQIDESYISK